MISVVEILRLSMGRDDNDVTTQKTTPSSYQDGWYCWQTLFYFEQVGAYHLTIDSDMSGKKLVYVLIAKV